MHCRVDPVVTLDGAKRSSNPSLSNFRVEGSVGWGEAGIRTHVVRLCSSIRLQADTRSAREAARTPSALFKLP
jgi:hypothetical protein